MTINSIGRIVRGSVRSGDCAFLEGRGQTSAVTPPSSLCLVLLETGAVVGVMLGCKVTRSLEIRVL